MEIDPEKKRRQEQIRRLATAAALETAGGYPCGEAWLLTKQLSERWQLRICAAARNPISDQARREVRKLVRSALDSRRLSPA